MATPILKAALETPAWNRLSILVRAHLAPVLADGPWSEHLVVASDSREELELLRRLRADAVLLLTNSFGAAVRARLARVPLRAGAALSGRARLLTHSVVPPRRDGRRMPIPTAHLLRDVAALVGIRPVDLHPHLGVRDEWVNLQRAELSELGLAHEEDFILCCPGAAFGAAKLWPPESFAAALDALHNERGWRSVITGGPGEEALVDGVAASCRHDAISLSRAPRDLERLKALVRESRLLLVGDSGPRWYAAAFDVPCVTVMGPNFPELTATSLELCRVVRRDDLECSPCLNRSCPLEHHRCMRELAPGAVIAAARELLARVDARVQAPAEKLLAR
jgi:heptosyltransferase-2